MKPPVLLAILIVLATSCRTTPVLEKPLQRVILESVRDRAGFINVFMLDSTAVLPDDLSDFLRISWVDSGIVEIQEALRDLPARNRRVGRWDREIVAALGVQPIGSSLNHPPFTGPHGPVVIEISGPGFSSDSRVAVVYYSYFCGSLCAGGEIGLFRKDPAGNWRVCRFQTLWSS
jgi:hypothetical protein